MAAKENDRSKTSKTARVMNLLSKKQDTAPAAETEETSDPASASASLPPIISSLAPDAAVSVQIKSALEDALEEELNASGTPAEPAPPAAASAAPHAPAAVSPAEAPASVEAPVPAAPVEELPVSAAPEEPPVVSAVPVEEAAPSPVEEPPVSVPVQSTPPAAFDSSLEAVNHSTYINVMQVLVEEKAEKYAKMFGLCTCHQCMDDVKALALNHLPPKYVVMDVGDRIPKLTFYEGQYSSDITAQLLKACEVVYRRPHHTR